MSIFLTINNRSSMKIGFVVASILLLLYAILIPQKYAYVANFEEIRGKRLQS